MKLGSSRARFLTALALWTPALGSLPCRVAAADSYTLRLSTSAPATSPQVRACLQLAAGALRRTNGQLKIEVYPSSQIATDPEANNALINGLIDLAIQAPPSLSQLFPQYQIFDAPFLFKDSPAAARVLDGPIGNELFSVLEPRGILGLCWFDAGFRELETTTRAVTVPDDMKGLRIRIPSGVITTATFQAFGAIPVSLDISEMMLALTQRTVDGLESPITTFTTAQYYNVAKHVSMINYLLAIQPITASKRKFEALPVGLQKVVREEARAAARFQRGIQSQEIANNIVFLKQHGVTFTEVQFQQFRRMVDPVYAIIQQKLGGDLLDRVRRTAGA